MSRLVNFSLLIPAVPLLSALLIGGLLISFNRTMNRLTKPVSFLIISSAAFSSLYSTFLLYKHVSGEFSFQPFRLLNLDYNLQVSLNDSSETLISIIGTLALILMITSFVKLPRSNGYVRYFVLISSLLGIILLLLMNPNFMDIIPLVFIK